MRGGIAGEDLSRICCMWTWMRFVGFCGGMYMFEDVGSKGFMKKRLESKERNWCNTNCGFDYYDRDLRRTCLLSMSGVRC